MELIVDDLVILSAHDDEDGHTIDGRYMERPEDNNDELPG